MEGYVATLFSHPNFRRPAFDRVSDDVDVIKDPKVIAIYQRNALRQLYTVKGSVYRPGTFSLKQGEVVTLAEALKKAGGVIPGTSWDSGADLTHIKVLRLQDGVILIMKLDLWHGPKGGDFVIKPGDNIYVPEVVL